MAKRSKPPVLIIVGVLNLIIGISCLCCMSFAMIGTLMQDAAVGAQPGQGAAGNNPFEKIAEQAKEQEDFIAKEVPGYKAMQIGVIVIAMLFAIGLLISSIGLFMGQSWGRWMCILVCLFMMLVGVGNAVWRVAMVLPAQQKFMDQQVAAGKMPGNQGAFNVGRFGAVGADLLWSVGYPILAIGLLMTPAVRDYFSNKGRREDDDFDRRGDYDDDYDDRPRRRRDDDYDDRFRDDYDR